MLHRAENEDTGEAKLKALNEDLRVWKAKVNTLATTLEREESTRSEQNKKIRKLKDENKKFTREIEEAGRNGSHMKTSVIEEQRKQAEEKER